MGKMEQIFSGGIGPSAILATSVFMWASVVQSTPMETADSWACSSGRWPSRVLPGRRLLWPNTRHVAWSPANPFTLIAAAIATGLAVVVFIFAYFFIWESTAWDILDPLIILALLTWAIAARRTNVGDAI